SAHAPIFKRTGIKTEWHLSEDNLDEYVSEVLAARDRWRGKMDVYLGFEVDYIKGLRSAMDSDIKNVNPDYIIGSAHYLVPANGCEPFTVDGPSEEFEKGLNEGFGGDGEALMHCYYDTLLEMITVGGFDILGHADLVKKNSQGRIYLSADIESFRQNEIARAAASERLVVEANTGGLNRNAICDTYPSLSFLRLFYKWKVPVIITADAHRAADIDGHYDMASQTLFSAGFSEYALFAGKDNGTAVWQKEKISI
ncbi:MAG: PHP domain-containing protein, partial [Treponema sp.]|nr:PHP domain-containing protein [Treponema sp.]